jgi:hypothetical protein
MRFFGLVLVVVAMAQSASGALLCTWDFNSGAGGTVANDVPASATSFVNVGTPGERGINGAISSQSWATATNVNNTSINASRYNEFTFTNNYTIPFTLESLSFDMARVNGAVGDTIRMRVTQQVGAGPELQVGNLFTSSSLTLESKQGSLGAAVLAPGETATYRFYYARSGSNNGGLIDNIRLNGEVPEPASIAIFGLLGVGAAARRFRRK